LAEKIDQSEFGRKIDQSELAEKLTIGIGGKN